ncbi:unnamed protein product [Cylicocyclus nassatus]|uniref:Uncharacterized protein n=1 Tax=Cylicocyclus nassatus TaxID=53992 RepID=A0AA36GR19_CYLNA|nr:unnamed protein product [Cylicocyclus nassatus]
MCTTFITALLLSSPALTSMISAICVDMASRSEIRTISAVERAQLLAEFKHQRREMGPRRFTRAVASSKLCSIIRRMDEALTQPMPYWDARWDLRLPRPADSAIFSEDFFPKSRKRRTREKFARESVPRGLNSHFRQLGVNTLLTEAIRSSRAAQLMIILYQLGTWKATEEDCSSCPRQSRLAFCDQNRKQCVARVMRTGNCSGFIDDNPCYASRCVRGVCVPLLKPTIRTEGHPRRKIAERAAPLIDTTTTETVTSTPDPIEALLEIANEEQLSDDYNLTLPHNFTYADKSMTSQLSNKCISLNGTVPEKEQPSTTQSTRTTMNVTTKATTTVISFTNPLFDNPHFDRRLRTWVYGFDDFLPYPSVYFPVTVVHGDYKPHSLPSYSLGNVMVYSQGENLPNGYTHIVEALPLEHGYIIRIPDPASVDVLVEFSLMVKQNGRDCPRLCLHKRRYIPCRRSTVRLSKYPAYSEKLHYFKTPRQVIDRMFKGAGYFRRRKQDAFLFTCPN